MWSPQQGSFRITTLLNVVAQGSKDTCLERERQAEAVVLLMCGPTSDVTQNRFRLLVKTVRVHPDPRAGTETHPDSRAGTETHISAEEYLHHTAGAACEMGRKYGLSQIQSSCGQMCFSLFCFKCIILSVK